MPARDDEVSVRGAAAAFTGSDIPSHAGASLYRTWDELMEVPEWAAWVDEHLDADAEFFMYFEDRDNPRIVVRGNNGYYYVPAHTLARMPRQLRMQFRELYYRLLCRWAEKHKVPAPPQV